MRHYSKLGARLLCGAAAIAILSSAGVARAEDKAQVQFDIPAQPLTAALNQFGIQSGSAVLFKADVTGAKISRPLTGPADPEMALAMMLDGTGLSYHREGQAFVIVSASDPQSGSAAGAGADAGTVQALIVTAQKREENIQDVPIAMSAFSQEDLTRSQVATGADLMTQVPNMTFTKTNFTGYSIQIRGIGTQAISVTTDPAVAVAFNNTPFIRNRFFEQEFYDLQRIEVLRGPQGTLYGRNATAGVVNLISQKPKFTYEAKLSADVANYNSTRLEGMLNIPLVDDKVALRLAGAWTKRDGFTTNSETGQRTDGRDLWSTRLSLRFTPIDKLDANFVWEHFQEDDDRLRSGKQLCHRDDRRVFAGYPATNPGYHEDPWSQGCLPASLYSPDSYQAPYGPALPYKYPNGGGDVYASTTQSSDLRVIQTELEPHYRAKSDLAELQVSYDISDRLTLTSETGYNADRISSVEDYNRFAPAFGTFSYVGGQTARRPSMLHEGPYGLEFCDPQLGCSDHLLAADLSKASSRQFSQELRIASDYDGAFNFSLGANFLRYDTLEKYYVFVNTLTMRAVANWPGPNVPAWPLGSNDNYECMLHGLEPPNYGSAYEVTACNYIDPNPIEHVNDLGHNYFLSSNPYKLISYAVFGEAYYNITKDLKLTAGLRWTIDKKEAPRIPSWLLAGETAGHPVLEVERQEWREPTGRLALDWKPRLDFTDDTLLYVSYSHGYKAGGSNPPPPGLVGYCISCGGPSLENGFVNNRSYHPLTFEPEFVNAFEVGTKNTLLDGRLTLNGDSFYYDYTGYQVSQIIDRSAVNYNFDAKIWGAELELDWRPLENLRLGLKGGYENTRIAKGEKAVDVMERNYGHGPDSADPWLVIRPFPTFPSNCVLPLSMFTANDGTLRLPDNNMINGNVGPCEYAYVLNQDPATLQTYMPLTPGSIWWNTDYTGFNPATAPNHGAGFDKPIGGHELPNAPHFTTTITADYTLPLPSDWLVTLHTDLYYQSEAWTRVFNDPGYDKLKAFSNINVAAIFSNEDAGWKVMAYVKNVLNKDNITGAFLNSDDSGLTTNVFLVEPRLYGLRVTKEWNGGPWWTGANPNHTGPYPLSIELGGQVQYDDMPYETIRPGFESAFPSAIDPTAAQHRKPNTGDGREVKVTYRPEGGSWSLTAGYRYGRVNTGATRVHSTVIGDTGCAVGYPFDFACDPSYKNGKYILHVKDWSDSAASTRENHKIVDFAVGKDVGLGAVQHSTLSASLRYAEFKSTTDTFMAGLPDWNVPDYWVFAKYSTFDRYRSDLTTDRQFKGMGPAASWEAGFPLVGNDQNGHVNLDWSVSAGVLFGKQKVTIKGRDEVWTGSENYELHYPPLPNYTVTPVAIERAKSVSVPVVDLSLGLSYDIQRIKVGAGYRWERYFNVLDTGFDTRKADDRTIDGPYFKIAVGFGG
jgi:outer membrane receptor protein involved in Fe transport